MTKEYLRRQFQNFKNVLLDATYATKEELENIDIGDLDLEDYTKNEDVSASYKGKKVVHMGDSWIQSFGLAEKVATKIGYDVINCGFTATSISPYAELIANAKKFALINLAKAIRDNELNELDTYAGVTWSRPLNSIKNVNWATVDLLILSYGVNDYGAQNPLGDISARDEESVCGALTSAISIFQSLNPNMEIVVTTPCYRYIPSDASAMTTLADRTLLENYRNAIGLTAMNCGIRLIDMRALSGINQYNYATTLLSDGLHPTSLGIEMWANAFAKTLVSGYGGAFDVSNDFSFDVNNLCFDSEKLTKHKKWNATYTINGIKYLCTNGSQQYRDCILGMIHYDVLPIGTTIAINGYGRKTTSTNHRLGFIIKNADKSSTLLEKYSLTAFKETDGPISYSFTTTEEYTDCWIVFNVKQMTSWADGKALVRDMKCTVTLPTTE